MMKQQTDNTRSGLLDVANEYIEQGYRVVIQPTKEDLPKFLAAFKPDIIAYGNDENVVVEVKNRHMLAESDYLPALADTINSMPGWRLDLASNPQAAQDAEELSRIEIRNRLVTVQQLSNMTQEEAATVLAWSATEAALRLVAKKNGVQLESDEPMFIVKKLFSLGILSREDYELFYEGVHLRNVIVHGYRPPILNGNLVSKLTKKVEVLLDIDATSPAA